MMTIKRLSLLTLGGILAISWSCSSGDNPFEPELDQTVDVSITNGQFVPQQVTISAGTTVRWTNKDGEVRTVESGTPMNPTSAFNSPNLQPNQSWPHTFTSVGTFDYYSSITGATGKVIVQ
ncbi:MAG: cupredoxin domain-containing protein [bacterium]